MADMCRLALQGNVNEARIINERLMPLHQNLFVESNPIPVKWAMAELDMIQTGIRLPLTTLSNQYHDLVRQALAHAGLI